MQKSLKETPTAIGLATILLLGVIFLSVGTVAGSTGQDVHSTIAIDGDEDFTGDNGVTGGNGSSSNPYIIEGWDIDSYSDNGIVIRNTTATFIVRNVFIHSVFNFQIVHGILLSNVSDASVVNSIVTGNYFGITIQTTRNVAISNNAVSSNVVYGIYSDRSDNLLVANNSLARNQNGIWVTESMNATIVTNTLSSHPTFGITAQSSVNVLISKNVVDSGDTNITVRNSSKSMVSQNMVSNAFTGINLFQVTDSAVQDNVAFLNNYGLGVDGSNRTVVSGNTAYWNRVAGIEAGYDENVLVTGNYVFSNTFRGIQVFWQGIGVVVEFNIVTNNTIGISVELGFEPSTGVKIHHNDMISNSLQANDDSGGQVSWDDGYPNGGNYWSDYSVVDRCAGSRQDHCNRADGIGDTPYVINQDSSDNYPLVSPVVPGVTRDVAVTDVILSVSSALRGEIVTVVIEVTNQGELAETLSLTLYANSSRIANVVISGLLPGGSISVSLSWDTILAGPGVYNVTATASVVAGEIDITDNLSAGATLVLYPDESPPTWPAGSTLTVSDVGPTSLVLNWSPAGDDVGLLSYRVFLGTSRLATVAENVLSYRISGLSPNSAYAFTVEAGDTSDNWSTDGPRLNVTTAVDSEPPRWPADKHLIIYSVGTTSIRFGWSPGPYDNVGVTSIKVYQGTALVIVDTSGIASVQVYNLSPDTSYTFTVQACDASGNCSVDGPSGAVTTAPLPPQPSPPPIFNNTARLRYLLSYMGAPSPGGTIVLVNQFSNEGRIAVRVTGIVVSSDFGTFQPSSGLPLILQPGAITNLNMTIQIPRTTRVGNHTITASVSWQYFATEWFSASALIVEGSLPIQESGILGANPLSPLLGSISESLNSVKPYTVPIVVGYFVSVSAFSLLEAARVKSKRRDPPRTA